ncbi:MAG: hypothetical protein AAFO84_10010 [Cyanobacteria bacterium J06598_1]
MALLEIDTAQILDLIKQLPLDSKRSILDALREDIAGNRSERTHGLNSESQSWLEASLTEDIPEYDWGPEGVPEGIPVKYVPGKGVLITEASTLESKST